MTILENMKAYHKENDVHFLYILINEIEVSCVDDADTISLISEYIKEFENISYLAAARSIQLTTGANEIHAMKQKYAAENAIRLLRKFI